MYHSIDGEYTQHSPSDRYACALRLAPKLNGKIMVEELPEYHRRRYLKSRKKKKKKVEVIRRIWELDKKVYLHKYYPWCYVDYVPKLVLQGWYNVSKAKKAYIKLYGKDYSKYVKFIKGKKALEKDFKIGTSLYINGKMVKIHNKSNVLSNKYTASKIKVMEHINNSIKGSTNTQKRKNLDKDISYYQNGSREPLFQNKSIKKIRLQKMESIKNNRKKDLYIE